MHFISDPAETSCPALSPGFFRVTDKYYKLSKDEKSYNDAKTQCISEGARLAQFDGNTSADFDAIIGFFTGVIYCHVNVTFGPVNNHA